MLEGFWRNREVKEGLRTAYTPNIARNDLLWDVARLNKTENCCLEYLLFRSQRVTNAGCRLAAHDVIAAQFLKSPSGALL